jgi:hypothetical protein
MTKINKIIKVLNQFKKEDRLYWIKSLVDIGDLTQSEAGYIITIEKL